MDAKAKKTVVIAIDKFKGSLSAREAADIIEGALSEQYSGDEAMSLDIVKCPMADGGDGSLEVVEAALHSTGQPFKRVEVPVVSLLGSEIKAPFVLVNNDVPTAFIEMAKVCGLSQVLPSERNPLNFTTFGLGQLICCAIEKYYVKKVVIAIGGSATNDGGRGMLSAMSSLNNVGEIAFEVACDVRNPLLGADGATYVYGPQKFPPALSSEELQEDLVLLEERMEKWARTIAGRRWKKAAARPGAGAAGGVGFALETVLGANIKEGWRVFTEMTHLEERISTADLVITGEGKFDSQSLSGKLPYGISLLCKKYNKPLVAVCGVNEIPEKEYLKAGFSKVLSLSSIEPDTDKCMRDVKKLLWHLFCNFNV